MNDIEQAARVVGPIVAADATNRTGVIRVANTGSAQTATLPTSGAERGKKSTLAKRFIRIAAVGANVQFGFGIGSAPTIVLNQASAVGTGHVSAGATLFSNNPEQFLIPSDATHIGWISDAAAGYLEFYVSDKAVV